MNQNEKEILEISKKIFDYADNNYLKNQILKKNSERCIEVPWFADKIRKYDIKSLLDVGFSMSSHDYLGLLLYMKKKGLELEAIDIVRPSRVKSRYPQNWIEDVFNVPIYIGDITNIKLEKKYDAISIISTLEHVGFDKATHDNINTAFERKLTPEEVVMSRDDNIEEKVFRTCFELLKDDGYIFLSVPVGKGGSVLLQDSLGYYTAQWEYEQSSWQKISNNKYFKLIENKIFVLDEQENWIEVNDINKAKNKTSQLKKHATGVIVAVLKKNNI